MKTYLSFAAAGLLLLGLTISQPVSAQDKGGTTQTGNRNQGKVRPNFVDANGDGICDNQGTGTKTGQRLRLRDGSCGTNPAPAGAAAGTGSSTMKRRGRGK